MLPLLADLMDLHASDTVCDSIGGKAMKSGFLMRVAWCERHTDPSVTPIKTKAVCRAAENLVVVQFRRYYSAAMPASGNAPEADEYGGIQFCRTALKVVYYDGPASSEASNDCIRAPSELSSSTLALLK